MGSVSSSFLAQENITVKTRRRRGRVLDFISVGFSLTDSFPIYCFLLKKQMPSMYD
jgi:hypothetical protein